MEELKKLILKQGDYYYKQENIKMKETIQKSKPVAGYK